MYNVIYEFALKSSNVFGWEDEEIKRPFTLIILCLNVIIQLKMAVNLSRSKVFV